MEKTISFILAGLLLLCLLDMPYGYFQFVRVAATVVFILFAIQANQSQSKVEMVAYIALAILFQPIEKISLGREIWNAVDVIVAVGLIILALNKPSKD